MKNTVFAFWIVMLVECRRRVWRLCGVSHVAE